MARNPAPENILENAVKAFSQAIEANLVAIIRYGNVDIEPTLNLLIVASTLDGRSFQQLADAYETIDGKEALSFMLMTLDELTSSTDVFPITFLEMRRNYELLAGTDVLAELEIQQSHLRLRCEQELRNLQLRMQSSFVTRQHEPNKLTAALSLNLRTFMRAMSGALSLIDRQLPKDENDLLREAATCFGLDHDVIKRVRKVSLTKDHIDPEILSGLYLAFVSVVRNAASAIDKLPEEVSIVDVVDDVVDDGGAI